MELSCSSSLGLVAGGVAERVSYSGGPLELVGTRCLVKDTQAVLWTPAFSFKDSLRTTPIGCFVPESMLDIMWSGWQTSAWKGQESAALPSKDCTSLCCLGCGPTLACRASWVARSARAPAPDPSTTTSPPSYTFGLAISRCKPLFYDSPPLWTPLFLFPCSPLFQLIFHPPVIALSFSPHFQCPYRPTRRPLYPNPSSPQCH
ncbi:hypothetical protein FQN60_007698 [Etheostoma spectabile]|uniref:Uncharacterized protein n=1 Tax=Etheostoma spectabile TaxID=54343 RepID=A0A5J5CY99_9PERO|nr:hypothetical protein FQN60_007698 [Etheostoma spectabile]